MSSNGMHVADACGEVPSVALVVGSVERLRDTGYLDRFDFYLAQLGLTDEQRRGLSRMDRSDLRSAVEQAGDRAGWRAAPTEHLEAAGCQLVCCVGDPLIGSEDDGTDPATVLDWYSTLPMDVRQFVGVDPAVPANLSTALQLRDHRAFAGIALVPFKAGAPLDDSAWEPVLEAAANQDIAVWVHTSGHFRPDVAADVGHPRHIDTVMMRYPGLRLIQGHAGWPWTADACLVSLRHPTVALEFSTFPPKLLARAGWSLDPLLAHRHALKGRIFFGSGTYTTPDGYRALVDQLVALDLGGGNTADWSGGGLQRWLDSGQESNRA